MLVLGVDTSTPVNTVAVCDGDRPIAETVVDCGRAHAERLMATVDWVLREAGVGLPDIKLLAVSVGPGSFTGLRIGVAAWKGLALANGIPLIGVSTLDAMSRLGAFHDAVVCPMIDAKMKEVFAAAYRFESDRRQCIMPERVAPVPDILADLPERAIFFGDGALLYRELLEAERPGSRVLPATYAAPRAGAVCAEALARKAAGDSGTPESVVPVYLRMSQPEVLRDKATT